VCVLVCWVVWIIATVARHRNYARFSGRIPTSTSLSVGTELCTQFSMGTVAPRYVHLHVTVRPTHRASPTDPWRYEGRSILPAAHSRAGHGLGVVSN